MQSKSAKIVGNICGQLKNEAINYFLGYDDFFTTALAQGIPKVIRVTALQGLIFTLHLITIVEEAKTTDTNC